jgi:uncharacterized membrane protein
MTHGGISPTALATAYWLHMLATVVWIGGLACMALLVLPAARKTLESGAYAQFLGRLQDRLQLAGWMCLLVLSATGMFQMSANPNYGGFLAIENRWAAAILTKHIAIALMVMISAYSTWGLMPQLKRSAMLRALGKSGDAGLEQRLLARENLLLQVNLLLSVLVLALTAWARVA